MKIFSEQKRSISYFILGSKGVQRMELPIHHTLMKGIDHHSTELHEVKFQD